MRRALDIMGIPHLDNPSHIIPVMVGDAKKCKMISDWLMDNHRDLCTADQLSDRAGGDRASARHAFARAHRWRHRPADQGAFGKSGRNASLPEWRPPPRLRASHRFSLWTGRNRGRVSGDARPFCVPKQDRCAPLHPLSQEPSSFAISFLKDGAMQGQSITRKSVLFSLFALAGTPVAAQSSDEPETVRIGRQNMAGP